MRKPKEHQLKALAYCSKNKYRVALFMRMRLGKTKVLINHFQKNVKGRILVIAPLTTLKVWERELKLENEGSIALIIGSYNQKEDAMLQGKRWNLINYEGVNGFKKILYEGWSAVALDESSRLRNPSTVFGSLITNCFKNTPFKAILSGIPNPESPLDFIQQFKFLNGDFLGFTNWWHARAIMCYKPFEASYNYIVKKEYSLKIKNYIKENSFVMTRKDAGFNDKRISTIRYIPIEKRQKELMNKVEKEFVLITPKGDIETKWVPVAWTWLNQLAGGFVKDEFTFKGKANELLSLLKTELKVEKAVVWFRYNNELKAIKELLKLNGISTSAIYGDYDASRRWEEIKNFEENKTRVILCQEKIGLYGLNLSTASTNIYYSRGYSSEVREQTKERVKGFDYKTSILDIDLVTENSIDEEVLKILERKKNNTLLYLKKDILSYIKNKQEINNVINNRS